MDHLSVRSPKSRLNGHFKPHFLTAGFLLLIVLFKSPFLQAQYDDRWNIYQANYELGPGSTLINLSYNNRAPITSAPYIISVGARFTACDLNGLPMDVAFPELYRYSDSVTALLSALKNEHYVGTFTYQCERRDYHYVSDTTGLRQKITDISNNHYFGFVKPFVTIYTDSMWNLYRTFLYPNEETLEFMMNKDVLLQLIGAGDDPSKERKIEHWFYFSTASDRDSFIEFAANKNFALGQKDSSGSAPMTFRLSLTRDDKAEIVHISAVTLELKLAVRKYNGVYDGWESPVTK